MTSYDRLDWHVDSAIEAGQPPENGFTHIGLYLAWLIRHDLHDPAFFPSEHIDAVKRGEMTGSDLADDIDTKLGDFAMNAEGRAFSDACYRAYLDAYSELFGEGPEYGVVDNRETYALVEPLIDGLYAGWVGAGRPQPTGEPHDGFADTSARMVISPNFDFDTVQAAIDSVGADVLAASDARSPEQPHAAPELEALIPHDLTSPPMEPMSVTVTDWGSSLLRRALKMLDVDPAAAFVVNAIGGRGPRTLTVTIYAVSDVPADRLLAAFDAVIGLPGGKPEHRLVSGRDVMWSTRPEFTSAHWAREGMIIGVAGEAAIVEAAIRRLP